MKKNNSAYIILLLAALFFFFIKINQRGKNTTIQSRVTVQNATDTYLKIRDTTKTVFYNDNIQCRMKCMGISKDDVKEVLQNGELNFDGSNATENLYPIKATTKAGKNLVVGVVFEDSLKKIYSVVNKDTSNNCDMCK